MFPLIVAIPLLTCSFVGAQAERKYNVDVTRVFDASVEQVWKAWSDPQLVMRWWGPTGFTAPVAKMDFREGGTSLVCMRAPKALGGQDMYSTWTYEKIVPHRQIEFVFRFSDKDGKTLDPAAMGMPAGIPKEIRQVVTFKPLGKKKTEMTMTEYGYTTAQAHDLSKAGLQQCFDKMVAIFNGK